MKNAIFFYVLSSAVIQGAAPGDAFGSECVVLLHGLARSRSSMGKLEKHLAAAGFGVLNAGYPSRSMRIEDIAETCIPAVIEQCRKNGARKIHFVAHSMGGIIIRLYLKSHRVPELGRVVMLSPPNAGSEVVDRLKDNFFFRWLNGPAGGQLGTEADSLPRKLGRADFELGIITGDRTVNPILSTMIPGPDDGKVSVERARLDGMKDFIVIHATHPFIMKNREAIRQTIYFLKNGMFQRSVNLR